MSRIIEVNNLKKHFENTQVLHDISLTLNSGDVVALIGPSGSGKSTFLRCINLLEDPTSGSIYFYTKVNNVESKVRVDQNGKRDIKNKYKELLKNASKEEKISLKVKEKEELAANKQETSYLSLNEIRSRMCMVFQNFNLFENLDVLHNCMIAQETVLHRSEKEAREIALKNLEKVGMSDRVNYKVKEISGGQKQRVAIARALCMDPEVILFDEPTSALDPEMVGEVLNVIKKLASEGMSMIVVTHEMSFAHDVANKVVFMADGYIVEQGSPSEVIDNPTQERTKDFLKNYHNA